ncbi:hypothetical protein IQ07DRAFT_369857 [Pyrenochaeta sp. DS3sAY3a]|nr:hypothetical protein IQ07DRAFT_369857 [Pyrenochaeta sp. DS3sAY3a]
MFELLKLSLEVVEHPLETQIDEARNSALYVDMVVCVGGFCDNPTMRQHLESVVIASSSVQHLLPSPSLQHWITLYKLLRNNTFRYARNTLVRTYSARYSTLCIRSRYDVDKYPSTYAILFNEQPRILIGPCVACSRHGSFWTDNASKPYARSRSRLGVPILTS